MARTSLDNPYTVDYWAPQSAPTKVAKTYTDLLNANAWDRQQNYYDSIPWSPSGGKSEWSPAMVKPTQSSSSTMAPLARPSAEQNYYDSIPWSPSGGKSAWSPAMVKSTQSSSSTMAPLARPSAVVKNPQIDALMSRILGQYNPSLTGKSGTLESYSRNPALQSSVDSILKQISGINTNPETARGSLQTYIKNPETEGRINTAWSQLGADTGTSRGTLSDFTNRWAQSQKGAEDTTAQETGAISRWYTGDMANELEANRRKFRATSAEDLNRNLASAGMQGRISQISGAPSSYVNAQVSDATARSVLDRNKALATQERADLLDVANKQSQLAGQRQALTDATIKRRLVPNQYLQQQSDWERAGMGNLASLADANRMYQYSTQPQLLAEKLGLLANTGNVSNANQFYNFITPEQRMATALNPLGQASNIYNANTYWEKPYEPDLSGMGPVRSGRFPGRYPSRPYDQPASWEDYVGYGEEEPQASQPASRPATSLEDRLIQWAVDNQDQTMGLDPYQWAQFAQSENAPAWEDQWNYQNFGE